MYVDCIVIKKCNLADVGESVRLKAGYALYMKKNKYVIIASKGANLEKLSYYKVTKELCVSKSILDSIESIHISRNVRSNGSLYEHITISKIEYEFRKKYDINIKFFSFKFSDNHKDIRNIGQYSLYVLFKGNIIKTIEVIVTAANR